MNDFSKWIEPGNGGLPRLSIKTKTAHAHIYLHGAHVTHYQRTGERPILFMSAKSHFTAVKPIRGGVPICFPWFANRGPTPESPQHGFARLVDWDIKSIRETSNDVVEAALETHSTDATRKLWPEDFHAIFTVSVGRELRMALNVQNTSARPFKFEEALHTYFAVGDIRKTTLAGLAGTPFTTKIPGQQSGVQSPDPITFTAETDRFYANTTSTCIIDDKLWNRKIAVAKENSHATVVWNPWIDKAKAMADFGDDEWPAMLCVETVNAIDSGITLQPSQSHTMTAVVK